MYSILCVSFDFYSILYIVYTAFQNYAYVNIIILKEEDI